LIVSKRKLAAVSACLLGAHTGGSGQTLCVQSRLAQFAQAVGFFTMHMCQLVYLALFVLTTGAMCSVTSSVSNALAVNSKLP